MQSRDTQPKNTQKQISAFSIAPVQGMFESRPFVVQQQKGENSQQPHLKTSLMQAKKYGHHLSQMDVANQLPSTAIQPNKRNGSSKNEAIQKMSESSSGSDESRRKVEGRTSHAEERFEQAQSGDTHRQVGDVHRIVREGRRFKDTETGYDVYIKGDKVVIVDPATNQEITRFKNSRANTQKRIQSGRWEPTP